MHVRICPECGEEYRPEILVCADCGTLLVDSDDEAPPPASGADPGATADGDEGGMIVAYAADARHLRPLADALVSAGLPFSILPDTERKRRGEMAYSLVVPGSDAGEARPLLAAAAERHPELPVHLLSEPASEDEAEAWSRSQQACPACEGQIPAGARECPGCGLAFHSPDDGGE